MSNNFQEFYEQFNLMYNRIFPRIKKIVKDARDAEEIMQDTGMKIFQNQSNLKIENLDRWISTVARNLALNKRRARKDVSLASEMGESCDSPDLEAERNQLREKVRSCIKQLSDTYRIPIEFYYFDGFSYYEISKILGIPINTVKSRLWRGRQMLRKKMSEEKP